MFNWYLLQTMDSHKINFHGLVHQGILRMFLKFVGASPLNSYHFFL